MRRFLRELRPLVARGDRLVAAVSGGSDSTALLELLATAAPRLGFGLVAVVHVHHGLRGDDADADADFVATGAARLGAPFELRYVDAPGEARSAGESFETAARRLRYAALREVADRLTATIATGHTADDRLETALLRLGRGEGGLAGPKRRREDGVLRPLLGFTREELRRFLRERNLPWREDASNCEVGLRGKLRAGVVPPLAALFGGSLAVTSGRALDRLLDDDALLDRLAAEAAERLVAGDGSFPAAEAAALPPPLLRRVLRIVCGMPLRHGTEDALARALHRPRGQRIAVGGRLVFEVRRTVRLLPDPEPDSSTGCRRKNTRADQAAEAGAALASETTDAAPPEQAEPVGGE